MKKLLLCLLVSILIITGCENKEANNKEPNKVDKIKEQLNEMSLEEKIGQMLIVSYRSTEADENLISILNDVKPGGFILFSENFESYEQTKKFVNDINATSKIPMFISVDQEGGTVQRLKQLTDHEVTVIPPMYELGLTNDEDLAYDVGRVMGEELRVFDINMDFAPVLDIYSNPNNTVIGTRAFGTTSDTVSKMALSFSKGLESTGIISVYKHFPGHGDTDEDSHYTLPVVTKTKEELLDLELKPFIEAIDEGADVIMIGHLAVPSITGDDTPASLSKEIITDLLKEELGFDGLVITDALNMAALTNDYTKKEIYIKAINAGVDILLMASPSKEAIQIIKEAVVNGDITEEQINTSVEKILRLKDEKLPKENKYTSDYLGSSEHKEIISKIK